MHTFNVASTEKRKELLIAFQTLKDVLTDFLHMIGHEHVFDERPPVTGMGRVKHAEHVP